MIRDYPLCRVIQGKVMKKNFWTVKNRLFAGFIFLILLILITGLFSLKEINLLGGLAVKMYKHPLTVTRASLQANVNIIKMHRSLKDVALAKDSTAMEAARTKVAEYEKEVYKQYEVVTDCILGKEGEALIAESIQIFSNWKPIRDEVIAFMEKGQRAEAAAITKQKGAKNILGNVSPTDINIVVGDLDVSEVVQGKVLIVDDSALARKQISETLEAINLTYITASNGKEALEILTKYNLSGSDKSDLISMLVSDIEMPEMDGYTLTENIRQESGLENMYILLHTSLNGAINLENAKQAGANDMLTKFIPEERMQKIVIGLQGVMTS